jgi:hypothetical protein
MIDVQSAAHALGGEVSGRNSIVCPGPGHSLADRSLSIKLIPANAVGFVVHSFAGDDPLECRDYVRERLGLASWHRSERREYKPKPAPAPAIVQNNNPAFAKQIWDAGKPAKGTLVEKYLVETRGLELPDTQAIRFHPRLKVTGTDTFAATMVCAMTDIGTGEFAGIHRTFLTEKAEKIGRAHLGRKRGAVIRIDADDSVGLGLAIAEGVETTIAARSIYRPAWCVIDEGNMREFPLIAGIEHLEIFADNDLSETGERAARACRERWESQGWEVEIVMAPEPGMDIADLVSKQRIY